jgi:pyruvate dehydrogenase E2 component (dihydrolipoamide acetyltransferase)
MAKSKARKKARNSKAPGPQSEAPAGPRRSMSPSEPPPSDARPSLESLPPSDARPSLESLPPAGARPSLETLPPSALEDRESRVSLGAEGAERSRSDAAVEASTAGSPRRGAASERPPKPGTAESGDFHTHDFFAKSEEEIHDDHARSEAPDLHDDDLIGAPPVRQVPQRMKQLVIGVVGLFAAIGIAGAVMRKTTPRAEAATSVVQPQPEVTVQAPPPVAPPAPIQPPAPVASLDPSPVAAAASALEAASAAPSSEPAPSASAAPAPSASAAPAPSVSAAPAPSASAAPAPGEEDLDALTGGQLLAKARQAIAAGAASKAATYAKKAVSKGAGGSAYYVLGAAYQTMGSNGAAKNAYANCAKSGCPEAGECASLVEGM